MTNYSQFERRLHRQFLGDNQFSNFLFERLLNKSNEENDEFFYNIQFVFITGLARSGTTALLNKIYSSGQVPSILYSHMPFILSPKLANFFSKTFNKETLNKIERFHNDGIFINNRSPECLEEIYWIKADKKYNKINFYQSKEITYKHLKGYGYLLSKYSSDNKRTKLVIKNNNNHVRLLPLSKYFKNSTFLVLFRDPLTHSYSLYKQHLNFIDLQKKDPFVREYMKLIGHREFGLDAIPFIYPTSKSNWYEGLDKKNINYWLRQWIETYSWILEISNLERSNIKLICYEKLCEIPSNFNEICKLLGISNKGLDFRLSKTSNEEKNLKIEESLIKKSNKIYNELLKVSF